MYKSSRKSCTHQHFSHANNKSCDANTATPSTHAQKMDQIVRIFFWDHDNQTRKMHPIGWEKLTRTRKEGGLGTRKSKEHNQALLLKRVWHLQHNQHSIWKKMCDDKYLLNHPILEHQNGITVKPAASPYRKHLSNIAVFLHEKCIKQIGNGQTTIFSKWIPQQSTPIITSLPQNT